MSIWLSIGTVLTGITLIVIIFKLIVNKRMSEAQSVLWILIGLATVTVGIFPGIVSFMARKMGIWYPPSITFLIAYIGLLFIVLKNTVMISVHSSQINELLLCIILLKKEREELAKELELSKREGESN